MSYCMRSYAVFLWQPTPQRRLPPIKGKMFIQFESLTLWLTWVNRLETQYSHRHKSHNTKHYQIFATTIKSYFPKTNCWSPIGGQVAFLWFTLGTTEYNGGSWGSVERPLKWKWCHFNGEIWEYVVKIVKSNPTLLNLANSNPQSKYPGSAPGTGTPFQSTQEVLIRLRYRAHLVERRIHFIIV